MAMREHAYAHVAWRRQGGGGATSSPASGESPRRSATLGFLVPFAKTYLGSELPRHTPDFSSELKIFYGEKHGLSGRAQERDDDAVRWFRRIDEPSSKP